jgi:hypothetical protein
MIFIAASTYHGMHRLRFVLYDLGLKNHLAVMIFEHIVDAVIIIPAVYFILTTP